MTKHFVDPFWPIVIDDERFSNNGMVPSAALMKRLAETFNFVACRAKKALMVRAQSLRPPATVSSAAELIWPIRFRLSENTTAIRIMAGMSLTSFGVALGTPPSIRVVVDDTTGAEVTHKEWFYNGQSGGTNIDPGEIHHIDGVITGLTANTEYQLENQALNGARLAYLTVLEDDEAIADDTVTAVCNPGPFLPEASIYDAHLGDLIDANNKLWRHNATQLLSFTVEYERDIGLNTTATTYTNPLDGTTSVTAAAIGFNLFTQYHNTTNRTGVPVKLVFEVYRTAGAAAVDIRITDGTNSLGTTGLTASGFTTVTGTIPPQAGTKWVIQAKTTAGTTWELTSVSLYEYEA